MIDLLKAGLVALWDEDSELNRNMIHDLFMENGFPIIAREIKRIHFQFFKIFTEPQRHRSAVIELYSEYDVDYPMYFQSCLSIVAGTIICKSYTYRLMEGSDYIKDLFGECAKFNQQFRIGVTA